MLCEMEQLKLSKMDFALEKLTIRCLDSFDGPSFLTNINIPRLKNKK